MYKLLIIGAGPAGISMGVEAVHFGVEPEKVLILEKAAEHSFTIKKFYPDKKLVTANYKGIVPVCKGVMCLADSSKNETITYLDKAIEDHKLRVNYNEVVYLIEKNPDGSFQVATDKNTYHSQIVVIAVGILGKPMAPDYPVPGAIKQKVMFDITSAEIKNSKVLVVGGGDSASEYCQFLSNEADNNEVFLSYRRGEFNRMNEINKESLYRLSETKKVTLMLNSNINSLGEADGRPLVNFVEEEYGAIAFDIIIYALGGTSPANFLKKIGIEFHGPSPLLKKGYETNIPGMFLIGDLSAGSKGGSIIWAFNSANEAMHEICKQYLGCDVKASLRGTH